MQPTIFYCYDAYCGWCYGFSAIITKIAQRYKAQLPVEVLSGGMIISETPKPISVTAGYIQQAYKTVEDTTGIRFGTDYLWHINHAAESDWYPDSEKPAIALCIFKEQYPDLQVAFATDLQFALHYEGRDLCDDEAYRNLLAKYSMTVDDFYSKLHSDAYKAKAYNEFALVKKLQVNGFPALLLQENETRFYLISSGYHDYEILHDRIDNILRKIANE